MTWPKSSIGYCWNGSASGRLPNPEAALQSESPGLIIDRLSILALKIYHTREEAEAAMRPPGHAERNHERLAILRNSATTWRAASMPSGAIPWPEPAVSSSIGN